MTSMSGPRTYWTRYLNSMRRYRSAAGSVFGTDLTVLFVGPRPAAVTTGPSWLWEHPKALVPIGGLTEVVQPLPGKEDEVLSAVTDVVSLVDDATHENLLAHTRYLLVVTNRQPESFFTQQSPFLIVDVTESTRAEAMFLCFSIKRLASRWLVFRKVGLAQPFFGEVLSELAPAAHVSGRTRTRESALDILSFAIQVAPSITLQFAGFSAEVRRRFDSILEETLLSLPGALPFEKVLSFRKELARRFPELRTQLLDGEAFVKDVWR